MSDRDLAGAGFVPVPAGEFVYGPEQCYERLARCPPLRPRTRLELGAYWIACRPVSYRDWRGFLAATGHDWRGSWHRRVRGWRGTLCRAWAACDGYPAGHDDFPIVDVSKADAEAYCRWLSGRLGCTCALPSEQQWEKAARGTDGRSYPWGELPPRPEIQWQRAFPVGFESYLFSLVVRPRREWARAGWYWRNGHPVAIGSSPANISPYGCLDMSGNVWEWTSSRYHPDREEFHVVKGGSWGYSIHHVRLTVRSACSVTTPSAVYRAPGTGFRVAVVPDAERG